MRHCAASGLTLVRAGNDCPRCIGRGVSAVAQQRVAVKKLFVFREEGAEEPLRNSLTSARL